MRRFHCTDINVTENDIVPGEYYITTYLPDFGQITAVVKVRGGKEWVTAPDFLVKQTGIKKYA